jgi:hypothetical protein
MAGSDAHETRYDCSTGWRCGADYEVLKAEIYIYIYIPKEKL